MILRSQLHALSRASSREQIFSRHIYSNTLALSLFSCCLIDRFWYITNKSSLSLGLSLLRTPSHRIWAVIRVCGDNLWLVAVLLQTCTSDPDLDQTSGLDQRSKTPPS